MPKASRLHAYAFPAFFVVAGALHFVRPHFYAERLPALVPGRVILVLVSGALEVVLGLLAAWPRTRSRAAMAICVLVSAAVAANVLALVTGRSPHDLPLGVQWLRLAFLAVLAAWAWSTSRRASHVCDRDGGRAK